jgi:hypothetical protein
MGRSRLKDTLQGLELSLFGNQFGPTEQLAEKGLRVQETIPQRLKPHSICYVCGTDKSVPFQSRGFSANCEVVP